MIGKRFLLSLAAFLVLIVYVMSVSLWETSHIQLDTAAVNDTVETISENWAELQKSGGGSLPSFEHTLDYAVIDNEGNLVAATRRGLSEHLNAAIQNRDTIVDIAVSGETVGKAIFHNDTVRLLEQNRTRLITVSVLIMAVLLAAFTVYTFYLHVILVRPFQKMKNYAERIAAGNLDIPLLMDKGHVFGAFTESFDIMREELHKARENERKADRSKKELVASLSHDIKTPVASIKAVAEVMMVMASDEENKRQLEIINAKAEQINRLITDLFHATLEDLQALNVSVSDAESNELPGLIRNADYKGLVRPFFVPSCIISADLQRLQQVFDNIITNSYKYAGTDIEIEAAFEEQYLVICIIDFGAGVKKDELPLLFNKFYRGKDAEAKNGYGLGLYLSKYLLEQMGGHIRCENRPNGFAVTLLLRLSK
jgi:signal transduction histidine kinase